MGVFPADDKLLDLFITSGSLFFEACTAVVALTPLCDLSGEVVVRPLLELNRAFSGLVACTGLLVGDSLLRAEAGFKLPLIPFWGRGCITPLIGEDWGRETGF